MELPLKCSVYTRLDFFREKKWEMKRDEKRPDTHTEGNVTFTLKV